MQGVTVNVECAICNSPVVAYLPKYFNLGTLIIYKGECSICHTKVTVTYITEYFKKGGDNNAKENGCCTLAR